MSRLAEIYKQEVKGGGGIASAVGKRLGEKLDPRQIFDRSGIIATMFPSLRAYSATKSMKPTTATPTPAPSLSLDSSAFSDISAATKLSAKNSMVLPMMARDMNLMRQNIAKIVKLQGGSAAMKADMFFRRAGERESLFESAFGKIGSRIGSANVPGAGKKRDGQSKESALFVETSGILSSLLGGLTGAAAAGGAGRITGILGKMLPFLLSPATLGVLGVAGLAGLLYFLIKKDSGETRTSDNINKESPDFTPDERIAAAPAAEPASAEELRKVREGMRASEDPAVRAAAAELDRTSPLPPAPEVVPSPSPTPVVPTTTEPSTLVAEPVPSGAVVSGSGAPIMTGSGGYLTSGEETAPSRVTSASIPTAPGLPIDYKSYAEKIGEKESGGKYNAVNTLGYLGKYQFGAMALQDMGLVKKGTSLKGLDDPANWNIEGGKQAFLNNPQLQEDTMVKYTKQNFGTLNRIGVINDKSSPQEIAGYLAASHLLGPGGAKQLARGEVKADAYGTSSASYFKVGSATQGLGGASTMASAAPSAPTSGAMVASVSSSISDGKMEMMKPAGGNVVVDNSQRNTVTSAGSPAKPASTYDKDIVDALVSSAYA